VPDGFPEPDAAQKAAADTTCEVIAVIAVQVSQKVVPFRGMFRTYKIKRRG
jgi:hypothetical protein